MKIVVGILGEKGSGKETFGNYLIEKLSDLKVSRTRFSDIIRETLDIWHLDQSRKNLQDMSLIMRKNYGEGVLSKAMEHRIKDLESDLVIIDGVRWPEDVALLRKFKKNFLVYITAEAKIRFKRLKIRGEKSGEANMNFKQFHEEEQAFAESFIKELSKQAEVKIDNNGSFDELNLQIDKFIKRLQK